MLSVPKPRRFGVLFFLVKVRAGSEGRRVTRVLGLGGGEDPDRDDDVLLEGVPSAIVLPGLACIAAVGVLTGPQLRNCREDLL
jgi:hypothetical protein